MDATTAKRLWIVRFGRLTLAATFIGACWLLRPPALPGSLGIVASRVRVGMNQDEAVALIRASGTDNIDCFFSRGATQDGLPFLGLFGSAFDKLPSATEIAWSELELHDDQGRDLVITLGPGGVVSGVRLNSPKASEEWRYPLWYRAGR